jgi:type I restriction enzyme M protein
LGIVRLTTSLVLHTDEEIFVESGVIRTIYDPTCGTGGFLSDGIAQIKELSPTAKIVPFGQELDPETHALAMISMMIQGYETDKIKQGSTLSNDQLTDNKFHYGLANPPFGIKWLKDQNAVVKEQNELGYAGRFGPGLPAIKDGSMLFLMHLVSKMELPENGGGVSVLFYQDHLYLMVKPAQVNQKLDAGY